MCTAWLEYHHLRATAIPAFAFWKFRFVALSNRLVYYISRVYRAFLYRRTRIDCNAIDMFVLVGAERQVQRLEATIVKPRHCGLCFDFFSRYMRVAPMAAACCGCGGCSRFLSIDTADCL